MMPLASRTRVPLRTIALGLAALLAGATPASGQDLTGTYTVLAPAGNVVTLVLKQDRQGRVRGQLSGNETVVQIEGQLDPGGTMVGSSTTGGRRGFAAATLHGDSLQLMFADFKADGTPDFATAGAVVLFRVGTRGAPNPPAADPPPVAPKPGDPPSPGPASQGTAQPAGPDQQLTQLLLRSPWCSFSYSQASGRTSTSRYLFRPDGTVAFGTSTEGGTVNQQGGGSVSLGGGATGSVYGQSQGGGTLRWRVQQGMLQLDQGRGFEPVPLSISRNSNGYPIITADGTEYSQCN